MVSLKNLKFDIQADIKNVKLSFIDKVDLFQKDKPKSPLHNQHNNLEDYKLLLRIYINKLKQKKNNDKFKISVNL